MRTRTASYHKLSLLVSLMLLLGSILVTSERAYAQWPPFEFDLEPSFAEGKVTYRIKFSSLVDWGITELAFKIPLPDGTRFLEAHAQPPTQVGFDGAEITFFTAMPGETLKDAYFVLEAVDPETTALTAHAWISWQGQQSGDYLTEDVSIDLTKQSLVWQRPHLRLQLQATAVVADDVITYTIYPKNVVSRSLRMWDVRIQAPVPEGTTFLSAEAPGPFTARFDGREVSFSALELARETEAGPLSFKVSTQGLTAPFVTTYVWATWRNVGWGVGRGTPAQEGIKTGDIVVHPRASQWVVSDMVGDVPFSNYDVAGVALEQEGRALKVIWYMVEGLGPVSEPLEYTFYVDRDCRSDTGLRRNGLGVESRVRYKHEKDRVSFSFWDETEQLWSRSESVEAMVVTSSNRVVMWVPEDSFENMGQFCWTGEVENKTGSFSPDPPSEKVPDRTDLGLISYASPAGPVEPATN